MEIEGKFPMYTKRLYKIKMNSFKTLREKKNKYFGLLNEKFLIRLFFKRYIV